MAGNQTTGGRPLTATTPLKQGPDGDDVLLVAGFRGHEGISECFNFQLDLLVKNANKDLVVFEKLLGQPVTLNLARANGPKRFFSGICVSVGQGEQDEQFTAYGVEIVPRFELLNKRAQCRVFQHKAVPDILRTVLTGAGLKEGLHWEFDLGNDAKTPPLAPRNYCVQYRESDFNFASRLMEEDGLYYYFTHAADDHKMVITNKPLAHPSVAAPAAVIYENVEGGNRPEDRVHDWSKIQQMTASQYTLRDHHFELPGQSLEAVQKVADSVKAGEVTHQLKLPAAAGFEVYDYPGEYAQRFDGVLKGGSGKQDDVAKAIFGDGGKPGDAARTAGLRMDQETAAALTVRGASYCRHFTAGHQFELNDRKRQDGSARNGKSDFGASGKYLLTGVQHAAQSGGIRSAQGEFCYHNMFTCVPADVPYRPLRRTLKPLISGTQTAVVVGPKGLEFFIDKYGRVKVQFPWFRPEPKDQQEYVRDSSGWVRVGQVWAGARWGASFWPRIGQEVIVAFLEGDPDRPIIIGSVYNAQQLPPYLGEPPGAPGPDPKHPHDPKVSGIKTNTTPGGAGFNELRFDDTKGKQQLFLHAERNMDVRVKNDSMETVIGNRHLTVGWEKDGKRGGDHRQLVRQDKHLHVKRDRVEQVEGSVRVLVGGGEGDSGNLDVVVKKVKRERVEKDYHLTVKGNRNEQVGGQSLTVGGSQQEKVSQKHALEAGTEVHIKAGTTLVLEAGTRLTLKVGGNFVDIGPAGVTIVGTTVMINSGGSAGSGGGSSPTAPDDAKEAKATDPDAADDARSGVKSAPDDKG